MNISASIIEKLGLPMRILLLGENEVGNHSCKSYDIQSCVNNKWTEVGSISNCEDYQTLGLGIKINGKICHSLNGTGLALSRVVAAIIETYYNKTTNSYLFSKFIFHISY